MKDEEVRQLASDGIFENVPLRGKVEETHISWVILTKLYAYKLKKPIKLPFLDFSTLPLRKHYCDREIVLNNRFSDIYLGVLPIRLHNDRWYIGGEAGQVVDYAVCMKRLRESKRMDNVMRKAKVPAPYIDSLASTVASFHLKAEIIKSHFEVDQSKKLFDEIASVRDFVTDELGDSYAHIIDESIYWSNNFIDEHATRFQERIQAGFKRDVHGDLHSGNIFLYRKPILFDCIEFNDTYRQIDVLYEIAFLCMELEVLGHQELVGVFVSSYSKLFPCFEVEEDQRIFNYYKCLRANVRTKVHAMTARQLEDPAERDTHIQEIRKYLTLIKKYYTKQ